QYPDTLDGMVLDVFLDKTQVLLERSQEFETALLAEIAERSETTSALDATEAISVPETDIEVSPDSNIEVNPETVQERFAAADAAILEAQTPEALERALEDWAEIYIEKDYLDHPDISPEERLKDLSEAIEVERE